jgi:hypothetical protein
VEKRPEKVKIGFRNREITSEVTNEGRSNFLQLTASYSFILFLLN